MPSTDHRERSTHSPTKSFDSIFRRRFSRATGARSQATNPPSIRPLQPRDEPAVVSTLRDFRFRRSDSAIPSENHSVLPLSPSEEPRPFTNTRPKHVPIVIPTYALPATRYPRNPRLSNDNTSIRSPSSSQFSILRKSSLTPSAEFPGGKPRYVEINIPAWAYPNYLPDSPESASSSLSSPGSGSAGSESFEAAFNRSPSPSIMARVTPGISRTNTLDSSVPEPAQGLSMENGYASSISDSQTNLQGMSSIDPIPDRAILTQTPAPGGLASQSPTPQTAGLGTASANSGLSGLVCNVHRTTGREPRPLVGASTTVLGDKLYVFGGRKLSRSKPQLTNDLFELDLVRRHWTKLETSGDVPPVRYFHSVCALGDTKLVLYGGMSPAVLPSGQPAIPDQQANPQDPQPEVVALSDVHIYDVPSKTWMRVNATNPPQGRYAHCAAILPSASVFSSPVAANAAIHHNPPSPTAPNSGSLGITLDGEGGAEMIIVGGQDTANHYIEQINVFNLRSLSWTTTHPFGRSCGAYRSVTAPLAASAASKVGATLSQSDGIVNNERSDDAPEGGSALLMYSNYNFLDVRLELQLRLPDGTLIEKAMSPNPSPPGLRFPNGGVLDNHFVVSGTFLTSSKQEYALWALDLRNMTWSRIDAGSTFSQGSWNRGVLWSKRNTFVILGNRKRSLVEDYNHRRINFTNICVVELEAFGMYDNPRKKAPSSSFVSSSARPSEHTSDRYAGGRLLSKAAEDLGAMALGLKELCDMDFVAMNGDRIPANSHLVARRWGPYFKQIMVEGVTSVDGTDTATLRPNSSGIPQRQSSLTITPSQQAGQESRPDELGIVDASRKTDSATRPRSLYLPHTTYTIQALLQYLYTSSLPSINSNLCTPQILCSLLQLARPYRIDGLLEAVVERLHLVLDNRNTAAIFNAAAMAAGGGEAVRFFNRGIPNSADPIDQQLADESAEKGLTAARLRTLQDSRRPGTAMSGRTATSDEASSVGAGPEGSVSGVEGEERIGRMSASAELIWNGSLSAVVGLQKRGLRGLMEGRRIREQSRGIGGEIPRVGLGIA